MLVMGIDPSYTCTGVVILDAQCKLVDHRKFGIPVGPERFLRAGKALHSLLKEANSGIGLAILEDAAYGAPSRITVAKLKELSGVYKFILEAHHVEWLELSPSSAKKWITGKGTSEKHIVAREISRTYGIQFKNDKGHDLSDATALALWGVNRGVERGQETSQQETGKRRARD